jgi:hypothetical protein
MEKGKSTVHLVLFHLIYCVSFTSFQNNKKGQVLVSKLFLIHSDHHTATAKNTVTNDVTQHERWYPD